MAIRPKTRRRLLLLLLIFTVIIGSGAGVFAFRKHQIRQDLLAKREAGMKAFEAENYFKAMHTIGGYLGRYPEDVEAVYAYAQARQQVVAPKGEHLRQATAFYRRVLELEPGHEEARDKLLNLYTRIGFQTEALELADAQLEREPDNVDAIRAKAIAHAGLRQFKEARPFAERYAEAAPEELDSHMLLYQIYRSLDMPDQTFLDHARAATEQLGDDPLAPLLRAITYVHVNDRDKAIEYAKIAAAQPAPDADYAQRVASLFNTLGEHRLSLGYLEQAAGEDASANLVAPLAHRLWQAGRSEELAERLAGVQPTAEADAELLGLKALLYLSRGDRETAEPIIAHLGGREGDHVAAGWHTFLTASQPGEQQTDQQLINACDEALAYTPGNPYIHFAKANALASMQEYDLAIEGWRTAARQAPAWPAPVLRIAETLLATDRPQRAFQAARAALDRAPNNLAAALTLTDALHRLVRTGRVDEADRLMELVNQIQKARPNEPRSAMIRIDLLARQGKTDEASEYARQLMNEQTGLSADRLLQLAEISRRHDLGVAETAMAKSEQTFGQTPRLLFARAIQKAQEGDAQAGRQLIEDAIERAGDNAPLRLHLVRAQYLQQVGSRDAADAWAALADARPDNAKVQRRVLDADAAWNNLELIQRVLERLAPEDGESSSVRLRTARARYLLQSDASERAAAEAARLLQGVIAEAPSSFDARLLAVEAFKRQGNRSAAMEQLNAAINLKPSARGPQLELAAMLIEQGDGARAARILREAAEDPNLGRQLMRRAAALFGQLGEVNRAIDLVVQANGGDAHAPDLLLASLYRRANRMTSAEAVCRKLLEQNPSAAAVEFTADLLAADDRMDAARAVLGKLDELDLRPGLAHLVRGGFAARHESADRAIEAYQAAVEAAPENERGRSLLLIQQIALGRSDAALRTIADAAEALPDNPAFLVLNNRTDLLRFAIERPALRPLATAVLRQPQYQRAAIEAMQILQAGEDRTQPASEQTVRLRQLADRHPRFLALQSLLARLYMNVGQPDDAADIANRAMQAFPGAAEPAWMAAEALAAAGRWSEALGVSQEWRNRSANQPLAADMMIAEARMRLGQADSAVDALAPHLENALADPDANVPIIVKHARAYIADGNVERAAQILEPLTEDSAMWRTIWVRVASLLLPEVESAQTWLQRIERRIPDAALGEKVELARAWRALDERFDAPRHTEHARALLHEVADAENPPAEAYTTLAILDEVAGNLEAAERHYRRALELNPELALAANNLAMILINRKQDLDDALRFARIAVETSPRVAPFHDTYALALIENGQADEAVRQQSLAVELAPNNATFRINLAYILARAERFEPAAKLLDRLDRAIADPAALPEALRQNLNTARQLIDAAGVAAEPANQT